MAKFDTKWVKLGVDTFSDQKLQLIEGMPNVGESIEIIWIKLLCLAGKVNDNGYIYFSKMYDEEYNPELDNEGYVKGYTEEQLAILFHKPVDIIRLSIKTFIELEMIIVDRFGVIFLQNFYKYQSIEKLNSLKSERQKQVGIIQKKIDNGENISEAEKELLKKEQVRIRVKRYRERQKNMITAQNVTQLEEGNGVTFNEQNVTPISVTQKNLDEFEKSECNAVVEKSVTSDCYNLEESVENTEQETCYKPLQKTLQNALQSPIDKDIDLDIDKDIDSELEKKKKEEKIDVHEKRKNEKTDFEYINEKLDEVIGKTNENVKKECYSYLKYLSLEVILYAIVITGKARNPCWNYTKKVLDDYKSKKICTFNQLLEYLDKVEKNKNSYKNQTHYAFMDDMHTEEEWEALYDN